MRTTYWALGEALCFQRTELKYKWGSESHVFISISCRFSLLLQMCNHTVCLLTTKVSRVSLHTFEKLKLCKFVHADACSLWM